MTEKRPLDRLFAPSSVAVIGASNETRKGGGFLLKGLLRNNFQGRLYPVNPAEPEVLDLKSPSSVLDIPDDIDLAIIAVPAPVVPQIVAECGQKNVSFAVIHSAGFAELGAAGTALEKEVVRIAQQYGVKIIGPNCMGLYNPQVGLNTITPAAKLDKKPGWVSFIGQSGWASQNFIERGNERGLRFRKVISIGNQADLTIEDVIAYLGDDDETRVIGCYIEAIKQGRRFLQVVRQVSLQKPVIVWKTGRTEAGIRATASHTASLASNSPVFDAAIKQSGAVAAHNLEELVDLAVGLSCPVLPRGNRVGVVTLAGGSGVASADFHQTVGLEMPVLSREAQQELVATLRGSVVTFPNLQNPVDIVWPPDWVSGRAVRHCLRIVLKEVDAALAIEYAPLNERVAAKIASLRDDVRKPIMLIPGDPTERKAGMRRLVRNGIPTFTIPERALKVLAAMVEYADFRRYYQGA